MADDLTEQQEQIEAQEQAMFQKQLAALDKKMVFSRIFVDRPRFAVVIAIIMTLVGLLAVKTLPRTQYPEITPPEITVSAVYPGANAIDLSKTVAAPIEQEVNGVEDALYLSSTCTDSGTYSLSVTFAMGTDRDMNMVKVQNRLQQATSKLPSEVTQQGVTIRSRSSDILGFFSIRSPKGTFSKLDLSNYVYANMRDVLLRVDGVGEVDVYGPKAAMRIWLDPERMAAQGMSPDEVVAAISSQNIQASLGAVGASPVLDDNIKQMYTITARGRLNDVDEFDQIVVRTAEQGGLVRICDIARVEVAENRYGIDGMFNGEVAISLAINQTPGSNAIATMARLRKAIDQLSEKFPEDMICEVAYDATDYVTTSIEEVVWTLILTFILVVAICYLFLQDFRSTLVPSITIPVSLLSTFMVLKVADFSINTLTLFALVLAIGVVVDDAIVVVERVLYHMEKNKLDRRTATLLSMSEVTGAVIATTLVLLAIFVPVGFIPGITGRIYSQFAITISMAVVFSSVNALTLSPALCATILCVPKPHQHGPFAWFNRGLDWLKQRYVTIAKALSRRMMLTTLLLLAVIMVSYFVLQRTPTSFLPNEDQGVCFVDVSLKEGLNRVEPDKLLADLAAKIRQIPGVRDTLAIVGMSMISGRAENVGMVICPLKNWNERKAPDLHVNAIIGKLKALADEYPQASINVFSPPAIMGLGVSGGLDVRFQSLSSNDPVKLERELNAFINELRKAPELTNVFSTYTATTPRIVLEVDRTKTEAYKVPVRTLFSTLQSYLGSRYINDINIGNQVNQVSIQSDWAGRSTPESIDRLYVQSTTGKMIPVSALVTQKVETGPRQYSLYQLFPSAAIQASASEGYSSGQAMEAVRRVARETLSREYSFDWSGLSYQENEASGQTAILILAGVLFGYLFLVAQYESWMIPAPVMLSVSVAMGGGLFGILYEGLSLSIYAQLGLVLLIGLAAKNAILIVEFAAQRREQGLGIIDAAGDAAGQRLRAVLMTALTFVLGVLPLVYATGAGAAARREIGVTVYYGMVAATSLGLLMIPSLFALFQFWREKGKAFRKSFGQKGNA